MASIIGAVIIISLIALAFRLAARTGDDASADAPDGAAGPSAAAVLDGEIPRLEDLTSDVTVPTGPAEGLTVVDRGVSIVEDRFDPSKREGTFAAIIDNPHADWIAQGVQARVEFLDAQGQVIGSDDGFVELVLPMQRVAVSSIFFDAPTEAVADMRVTLDVAGWRQANASGAEFTTTDVSTEEAEFSGVRTTFSVQSSYPEPLTDVGVTAVFRNADGAIVGGYDTFIDRLEPNTPTTAQITLLANIAITEIVSTELYPYATQVPPTEEG